MTPSRLAAVLRDIAARIDNSKNPSRGLVTQELRKVLASVRLAGDCLPGGEIIPVAPSSGEYDPHFMDGHIKYEINNIDHFGEKGAYGLSGSISIDDGPVIHVDLKDSHSPAILRSSDPSFDVEEANDELMNRTGFGFADALAQSIEHAIFEYIKDNGIIYNQIDSPYMDLDISNNVATDTTDTDEE